MLLVDYQKKKLFFWFKKKKKMEREFILRAAWLWVNGQNIFFLPFKIYIQIIFKIFLKFNQ